MRSKKPASVEVVLEDTVDRRPQSVSSSGGRMRRTQAQQELELDSLEDGMAGCTLSSSTSASLDMQDSFTKEFLSCSICWETYDDKGRQPKLLSCHHTFCKGCLKRIQRGRSVVQCSTCRKDTEVLDGINGLQTNFYVMYMKQKFGEQMRANTNVCYKHALQPLSFFCKTCTLMVCRDCIVLAHQRSEGHELQELHQVKEEYVYTLERLRQRVEQGIHVRQAFLSSLRVELDTMEIVSEVTSNQIDATFDQLIDVVNNRRQQLKDTLKETHESRHRMVNEQLVEVDNLTLRLLNIRELLDDATCKGQIMDLVDVANDKEMKEVIAKLDDCQPLNLGKNSLDFKAHDAEASLQSLLAEMGEITDNSTLPSKIAVKYEDATACLESQITITVATHSGEPLSNLPIALYVVDPAGDEMLHTTTDIGNGVYSMAFRPQISGAHLCTVSFHGHKVASSCITIAVQSNDPVQVIGSMGKDEGKLMYPCSLTADYHGNLYIVDEGNQRIQKFCSDGSVEIIPVAGDAKTARTFDCALDIANKELICSRVVVEQRKAWADTIQIYSLDGQLKSKFSNRDMKKALYVAVNSKQEIIVPDYHLNKLFIYNHKGELLKEVGQHGSGPREFKEPAFVCIGRDDDIIISDCRNCRVQVLNSEGEFKYQIGSKGSGKGQLQGPSGVTTDEYGHILVTDRVNNRIQVYTYEGTFVSCVESTSNKLNDPRGLTVSKDGHVYVADQKNHCIKQYRYM